MKVEFACEGCGIDTTEEECEKCVETVARLVQGKLTSEEVRRLEEESQGLPSNYLDTGVTEDEKPRRKFGDDSNAGYTDEVTM